MKKWSTKLFATCLALITLVFMLPVAAFAGVDETCAECGLASCTEHTPAADCSLCGKADCTAPESCKTPAADCSLCGKADCTAPESCKTPAADCSLCGKADCAAPESCKAPAADCSLCGRADCAAPESCASPAVVHQLLLFASEAEARDGLTQPLASFTVEEGCALTDAEYDSIPVLPVPTGMPEGTRHTGWRDINATELWPGFIPYFPLQYKVEGYDAAQVFRLYPCFEAPAMAPLGAPQYTVTYNSKNGPVSIKVDAGTQLTVREPEGGTNGWVIENDASNIVYFEWNTITVDGDITFEQYKVKGSNKVDINISMAKYFRDLDYMSGNHSISVTIGKGMGVILPSSDALEQELKLNIADTIKYLYPAAAGSDAPPAVIDEPSPWYTPGTAIFPESKQDLLVLPEGFVPTTPSSAHTVTYHFNLSDAVAPIDLPLDVNPDALALDNGLLAGWSAAAAGCTFVSWNTDINGNGVAYAPGTPLPTSADINLYAQYADPVYRITYYRNYSITDNETIDETNVSGQPGYVDRRFDLANPNKVRRLWVLSNPGHPWFREHTQHIRFVGWSTKRDATPAEVLTFTWDDGFLLTSDTALYAVWEEMTEYVIFDRNNNGDSSDLLYEKLYYINGTEPAFIAYGIGWVTQSGVKWWHLGGNYTFLGWAFSREDANNGVNLIEGNSARNALPAGGGHVTLYAAWGTSNSVRVFLHENGGSTRSFNAIISKGTSTQLPLKLDDITLTNGQANINPPQNWVAAHTGSTLLGWNTASDGSGTSHALGATVLIGWNVAYPNNELHLYAIYEAGVTYHYNYPGKSETRSASIQPGNIAPTPIQVDQYWTTRGGVEFAGWNTAANGTGTQIDAGQTFTAAHTASVTNLYAIWKTDIKYRRNGMGGHHDSFDTTEKYTLGTSVPVLNFATDSRFDSWRNASETFLYWQDGDGNRYGLKDSVLISNGFIQLRAVYSAKPTFHLNDGSSATSNAYEAVLNVAVPGIDAVFPAWSAQDTRFLGWNTRPNGTGDWLYGAPDGKTAATSFSGRIWGNYYAQYEYRVSYNANNGTGETDTQTWLPAGADVLRANPSGWGANWNLPGYFFLGWNTTAHTDTPLGSYTMPKAPVQLYAVYGYDLTLVKNDGGPEKQLWGNYTLNQSYNLPVVAALGASGWTVDYHDFLGWAQNPDETDPANILPAGASPAGGMPAAPVCWYAIWQHRTHTLSYSGGGGTLPAALAAPITVNEGTSYTIPTAVPTRNGYSFSGWQLSGPAGLPATANAGGSFTVPGGDVTLTALWTALPPAAGPAATTPAAATPATATPGGGEAGPTAGGDLDGGNDAGQDPTGGTTAPTTGGEDQGDILDNAPTPVADPATVSPTGPVASWSLVSLVLACIGLLIGLPTLVRVFRRRGTDARFSPVVRILSILSSAGAVAAFLLLDSFSAPMQIVNGNTLFIGILFVVQMALAVVAAAAPRSTKTV